jgi:hypothetical protein
MPLSTKLPAPMTSKTLPAIRALTLILPLACSGTGGGGAPGGGGAAGGAGGTGGTGGMAGATGDGRLFVPEGLPVTLETGQVGVTLTLVAATLVQGATSAELYVAVRNDGTAPTCNAGMVTDFIDGSGQTVATAATDLLGKQLYLLAPSAVLNCIDPGEIAMGASTTLPAEVVIGQLAALTYRFPTFGVDGITPLGSFTVSQVQVVAMGAASAYQGLFTNALSLTASAPSVTIFPVNRVGRPLGAATSSTTIDVPPGGTWSFETSTVSDPGVDYAAYPSASVSN